MRLFVIGIELAHDVPVQRAMFTGVSVDSRSVPNWAITDEPIGRNMVSPENYGDAD
jgi:hypothetical protein